MTGLFNLVPGDEVVQNGIDGKAADRLDAQLGGDVLAVGDDRMPADEKPVGNLLVGVTLGHLFEHLGFPFA